MMSEANQQSDRPTRKSMHEDVPIWDDTPCCCEPEPRWQALADEQQRRDQSTEAPPNQRAH